MPGGSDTAAGGCSGEGEGGQRTIPGRHYEQREALVISLTAKEAPGAQEAGTEAEHRQLVQPGHHVGRKGQQPRQPLQLPVQPLPVPPGRVGAAAAAFGRAWPRPAEHSRVTGEGELPSALPRPPQPPRPHSRPWHRLPPPAPRVHGRAGRARAALPQGERQRDRERPAPGEGETGDGRGFGAARD